MYNKALHWFAVFTALCTFFLIIAGGLVTSTGSGLAVPDWPLSYGKLMPPMVGGIFYEHGHRLIASFVGVLTVILAIWIWRKEGRKWVRVLGFVAIAAVLLQGALGGLTVLLMLPTAVSVSHATLAQTFFCIVSGIALFTSKWWLDLENLYPKVYIDQGSLILCISISFIIYLQLILGAIMRHTGSGLAVPDFPLAYGQVLPSLSPGSLETYNKLLIYDDIRLAADGPITSTQISIHMLHRWGAVVVFLGVISMAFRLWRQGSAMLRSLSTILLIIVLTQVSLGVWTVFSRKAIEIVTAHVAVGALLLVCSVLITLCIARMSGSFIDHSPAVPSPKGVFA